MLHFYDEALPLLLLMLSRVAVPLPAELQGRRQSFEVGASVEYPDGKGNQLRFRDGITLRANTKFGNGFATGLLVAGALTGQIVYESPATMSMDLPKGSLKKLPIRISQFPLKRCRSWVIRTCLLNGRV